MLDSTVQQSESAISIHTFYYVFPFHLGYHRTLSTVLRAIRRFSLVTNFILVHSSVLAWRIPGMGKPRGLPSMGSYRVGHNWSNLAAAPAVQYVCQSQAASYPHPSLPPPFDVCMFVLYICVSISVLQIRSPIPCFRFHIYALMYGICFHLSDLLCVTVCSW